MTPLCLRLTDTASVHLDIRRANWCSNILGGTYFYCIVCCVCIYDLLRIIAAEDWREVRSGWARGAIRVGARCDPGGREVRSGWEQGRDIGVLGGCGAGYWVRKKSPYGHTIMS
jgi:hypothetical protein